MWSDEELSRALRSEVDGPAPPARPDLANVLRRGRRRLVARRAGAAAGVAVAVGVLGFGTAALRGLAGPDDPADGPTAPSPTVVAGPVWTTPDVPARVPYRTFSPAWTAPPPPDREILSVPLCDIDPHGEAVSWPLPRPPAHVLNAWTTTTALVAAPAEVSETHTRTLPANKDRNPDSVDGHTHWLDVTDAGGTGSVWLEVGRTSLAPVEAADADLFAVGNCAPPRRTTRDNGTVLQIYETRVSEPFQSLSLELRVYTPSGDVYAISVRNFGSPDFAPGEERGFFERTGAGRETLPLTEEQLTRIGVAVADAAR